MVMGLDDGVGGVVVAENLDVSLLLLGTRTRGRIGSGTTRGHVMLSERPFYAMSIF